MSRLTMKDLYKYFSTDFPICFYKNPSCWNDSLSHKEKKEFRCYRFCSYRSINEKLRKGIVSKKAKVISNALNRNKIKQNITVYRYINKHERADIDKNLTSNEFIYHYYDFISTHMFKSIYEKRKKSAISFIQIPKGVECANINNLFLAYRNENELLINCGYDLQILDFYDLSGIRVYLMRVISPKAIESKNEFLI